MQERVDLAEIADTAPALGELLKQNEDELIRNFLSCTDYALLAVEEPALEGDSLSFNAVIRLSYSQNDISTSVARLHYSWTGTRWICETVTEADQEAAQKPNYFLVLSEKQDASEKIFGTGNLLELFTFTGTDYRAEYEETYLSSQAGPEDDRDPNQDITITDDGFFDVTPGQLKHHINSLAGKDLITGDFAELDQGYGPIYEFTVGRTLRLCLFDDLEYGIYSIAVIQTADDGEALKAEEPIMHELISHATKACDPDKERHAHEAAVTLMERVANGEVENESYIELGALTVQATVDDGVKIFYLFSVPVEKRPSA